MRLMRFPCTIRTRRQLLLTGYLAFAMWIALEWMSTQYTHAILYPIVFISYICSFTVCTILSAVLYLNRPGVWLCEEKAAALLLMTPLVWSLI